VTMENTTRPLPRPFLVIATQNPHEHAGTYPLPESQKDRFLLRIAMGYPDARSEKEILREEIEPASLIEKIRPVADRDAVRGGIAAAKAARVEEILDDYILALIKATRESPFLELGVSPRGALGLRRAAQANAYVAGRDYVTPDDVKSVAVPALAHRLLLKSANGSWQTAPAEKILREILDRVPVPV
jgi:MoxR-like ATPase